MSKLESATRRNPDTASAALDIAREHYETAARIPYPDVFKPSQRWSHWTGLAAKAIRNFSSTKDAISFAQQKMGFEHRHSVENSRTHWPRYEAALLSDFPDHRALLQQINETQLSDPATTAEYSGRLMSNMIFWHAHEFLATYSHVPTPARIVEIGGGYGSLARLWLSHGVRPLQYWLTDFPESLYFAEVFLAEHFPDIDIRYALSEADLANLDQTSIVLIPAQAADRFRNIKADLVVNSGSMQEMQDATMAWWCAWIEENEIQHFYSLNYGLHPIHTRRGGSANWMCPRLGPYWETVSLCLDRGIVREQTNRHFREVFYKKIPKAQHNPQERAALADKILASHDTPVSIHREGAILELLDAVRLAPNPRLIMKLVEILSTHYDYRPKELVYVCQQGLASQEINEEERGLLERTLGQLLDDGAEEHDNAVPTTPLY